MDGVSESAAFLDSNGGAGRQRLGRDQIRSHCDRPSGSLRGAAQYPNASALDGGAGLWLLSKDRPADPIPEWGNEQRPQLLWAKRLLLAGSNDLCIKLDRWFADP